MIKRNDMVEVYHRIPEVEFALLLASTRPSDGLIKRDDNGKIMFDISAEETQYLRDDLRSLLWEREEDEE